MKTIGLIGGMSWESTLSYYQLINQGVKTRLGGLHSAKIILNSVDFAEVERLQHKGDWPQAGELLAEAAINVEKAGADFVLICTNTMHKVADQVQQAINIPLLHIADATAQTLIAHNIEKIGLLGTRFTMTEAFYKDRLKDKHNIDVVVPSEEQQDIVHEVIYQQLCLGIINPDSRQMYLDIIDDLAEQGAEGVILGCTEIGLLIKQGDTFVELFDTTAIHAFAAVNLALEGV